MVLDGCMLGNDGRYDLRGDNADLLLVPLIQSHSLLLSGCPFVCNLNARMLQLSRALLEIKTIRAGSRMNRSHMCL